MEETMTEKKSNEQKKPDLRDGLPGRETVGVVEADVAVNSPASRDDNPDIAKPGVSKRPAGQTTQE